MKILCIADHVDSLVYNQSIKSRFGDVDLVISSGDLPLYYYDFIMTSLNKPLLFVFGNHQLKLLKEFKGRIDIIKSDLWERSQTKHHAPRTSYVGTKVVRNKSVLIAGLGGSMWYNGGENQYTDFQMFFSILRIMPSLLLNRIIYGRFLDILITHAPPYGIHDRPDRCHTGFKVFLWFMRVFKPRYLVHGHVHIYNTNEERISHYYATTVVNAYDHQLIEMEV